MTTQAAQNIAFNNTTNYNATSNTYNNIATLEDEFLHQLADDTYLQEEILQRQKACLAEISLLRADNKWNEIIELFYPLEEKEPEIIHFAFDLAIRREIAFALSQVKRFDDAIKEFERCIEYDPDNFHHHSGLGFTLYNNLYAAKNKEILLPPNEKKERIKKAHKHLRRAQEIRPDRVTPFYRQAMLYKHIQQKPEKALPIFETAVNNWEKYTQEQQKRRHQEYKNYVKSLYNLASCQVEKRQYKLALKTIQKCITADQNKDYIQCHHKYFALGKIQFRLGHMEKAREALEFAATFVSAADGDYILELLARTLLKQNKKQEALKTITQIPRKNRRHFVIWTLADILTAMGQKNQAKQQLINSSQRDRRSAHRAYIRLCKIAFQDKAHEDSLKWALKADKFHLDVYNSHDPDALFWAAVNYLKLNQKEKAQKMVEELTAFRPDYPLLPKLKQIV